MGGVAGLSSQPWASEAGLIVQSSSRLHSVRQAWDTEDTDLKQLFPTFLVLWPFNTFPYVVFTPSYKIIGPAASQL